MTRLSAASVSLLLCACSGPEETYTIRVDATASDASGADSGDSSAPDSAPPEGAALCVEDRDCGECGRCNSFAGRCMPLRNDCSCASGDGVCEDGVCLRRSCAVDGACDDGNPCNGIERCGPDGCQRGEAPSCDDGDVCTTDSCSPLHGCVHVPLDADGDGHGPLLPDGCGDDCNDSNGQVFPSQTIYQSEPIEGMPAARDYDYDCDGIEKTIFDEGLGFCKLVGGACLPQPGFLESVPACGETGFMLGRCRSVRLPGGPGCAPLPDGSLRIQRCL